jgi:hypothetical protein
MDGVYRAGHGTTVATISSGFGFRIHQSEGE